MTIKRCVSLAAAALWTLIAAMPLAATVAQGHSGELAEQLAGYWTCEQRCPDEDIAFTIEDGRQQYASWLHGRPAVVNAEWRVDGANLTVTGDDEMLYEWVVIEVTAVRLVMRERDAGGSPDGDIVLKRVSVDE